MVRPIDSDEAAEYLMDSFWFDCDDIDVALQAIKLTPTICPKSLCPTREQVEKSWVGCEYCEKHKINLVRIEMNYNDSPGSPERLNPTRVPKFCPMCGRPLTDEAVEITLRRLEVLSREAKAN